jgi:hypothetical protein
VKVAETDCAVLIVTVQELLPVQAPPQLLKLQPDMGDALRVTDFPMKYA